MSYVTIYYYGLISSFVINLIVLYVNVYHNKDIDKTQYKNMVFAHYILSICSWVGVLLYTVSLIFNIVEETKNKGNKKR